MIQVRREIVLDHDSQGMPRRVFSRRGARVEIVHQRQRTKVDDRLRGHAPRLPTRIHRLLRMVDAPLPPLDIVLASWNNLPYLKLCVDSFRRHSAAAHRLLIHVNDGSDGTREWLRAQGIAFTESAENIGICRAFNRAARLGTGALVCLVNDDMYALPGWDRALCRRVEALGIERYMLSGTMIEPTETGNPCVRVADFGTAVERFREADLLAAAPRLAIQDWYGSSYCPLVMPRFLWDEVGGLSEEFSPGMSSDPDLAMKCWRAGCRTFLGIGDSLTYHFQCKSTGRVERNPGPRQFLEKWGIPQSLFNRAYLRKGLPATDLRLSEPRLTIPFVWHMTRGRVKSFAQRAMMGSSLR